MTVVADSADGDPLPPLFDPDPSVRAGAVEGVGFWRLVKLAESIRPSLIVIDPVSAAAGAVGLNDAVGARAIMRAFARLSVRTDAGVLVLAHDTKAARNDARAGLSPGAGAVGGSGQWFDAARCVLYLHRNRETGNREIECLKANHGRDGWAVPLAEVKTEAGSFAGYEAAPAGPMLDYEAIRAERRQDADAARKSPKVLAPAEIPAGTAPDDPGDRGWGTGTPA